MIQPSGTCSPLFSATISLPSATIDVVTSRTTGSRPATGTPIEIGFVDSRRSLPPYGATRCAPDVLRKCSDTWPAAAAMSDQSPTRPRWPQLVRPIIAMPAFARLRDAELRRRTRRSPGRSRDWPSMIAIVSLSKTRVGVDVRPQRAAAHPFEVLRNAQHAVRIVTDEIRIDEPARDGLRFVGIAAGAAHDRGDEVDELRGV